MILIIIVTTIYSIHVPVIWIENIFISYFSEYEILGYKNMGRAGISVLAAIYFVHQTCIAYRTYYYNIYKVAWWKEQKYNSSLYTGLILL